MAETMPEDLPDLREMTIVKRFNLNNLKVDLKQEATDEFDEKENQKFGFMFFMVRQRMICFANPSGQVIIPTKIPPKHIRDDLKDENIIKIGSIKDKFLIEVLFKLKVRGHFDPIPLQPDVESLFDDDLEIDPEQPIQTRVGRIQTIREIRDEIWAFWTFMMTSIEKLNLSVDANLMPWVHMILAKFSDVRGRMSEYTAPLSDEIVAKKMDASPYFTTDLTLNADLDSSIPTAFYHIQAISKNMREATEVQRYERRAELLLTDVSCNYPLCRSANHLTSDCPVLDQSCEVCHHRGHNSTHHEDMDQVLLDRLFLLFAPSHLELGQIWMKDKANTDDWSKCYLRMEWTPKAGAMTELPKPVPVPMSILLKRQADEEYTAKMVLAKKLEDQEAIVEADKIEKQRLDKILEGKKAAASTEKMDVDQTSKTDQKSDDTSAPLLSPDEEAEYERLKLEKAKRLELQQLREEAAEAAQQRKEEAAQKKVLKDKAKASSNKIKADKKKKDEAKRIEGLKTQKNLEDQRSALPLTDINEYVEDPEGYVGKLFRDNEDVAANVTILDTSTPGGMSAIGINPKTAPKTGKTTSAKVRPYKASVIPGSENNPIGLDETVPDRDEPMTDA